MDMRIGNTEHNSTQIRSGRGRAVLVGVGLDDAQGQVWYTRSSDCELLSGSESTHDAMMAKAQKIKAELHRLGYCLNTLTRDQIEEVQRIVERISAE